MSRVRIEVAFPVISIVKLMMMKWEGQSFPNVKHVNISKNIVFALNYLDILLVILRGLGLSGMKLHPQDRLFLTFYRDSTPLNKRANGVKISKGMSIAWTSKHLLLEVVVVQRTITF